MTSLDQNTEAVALGAAVSDQVSACVRAPWRILAVVAADELVSSLWLAEAVARQCATAGQGAARAFWAEGLSGEGVSTQLEELDAFVKSGGRAVVALGAMTGRRAGAPLLAAADGALLCVQLGLSTVKSARRAVELIGRDRFLGAVTVERRPAGQRR
jgi:hypothetical protein